MNTSGETPGASASELAGDERQSLLLAYRDGVLAPGEAVLIEARRIKADALARVMDWLCDSGFGFDFWTPMHPAPFSVYDLAAAYHRQDPSEDIEVWADTLLAETGQKYAEDAR